MIETRPEVYVVSSTHIESGLSDYFAAIGIPGWKSDAESDGDALVESAGRLCYKSWIPFDPNLPDASNPNVDRVRVGNQKYIGNLLKQGHGSVLEHVNVGVIFRDISRVFTHELVRHRAGMGYSQESLRFVRLSRLKFWIPDSLRSLGSAAVEWFRDQVAELELMQSQFHELIGTADAADFKAKKKLTSMARRLAPMGLATTIMATGNLRAWRHIINMRASEEAEEEMQIVMDQLAPELMAIAPAAFQDLARLDSGRWEFSIHKKV